MPGLEITGRVTEVRPATIYLDGDAVEGVELTVHQEGYADFCKQQNFDYYPVKVRGTVDRFKGLVPGVGDTVRLLCSATGNRAKDGRVFVNLRVKNSEIVKK